MSLEDTIEFIREDELVEVTPEAYRLRKRHREPKARRRAQQERIAG
jgi:GTP-binding protein